MKVECPRCGNVIDYDETSMGALYVCGCGILFSLPLDPSVFEAALKAELAFARNQMGRRFSVKDCFATGIAPHTEVNAVVRLEGLAPMPSSVKEMHERLKAMPLFRRFGAKIHTEEYLPEEESFFLLKFCVPIKSSVDEKYMPKKAMG